MRSHKLVGIILGGMLLAAAGLWAEDENGDDNAKKKATHTEVATIGEKEDAKFGKLSTICLTADGKLLAGDSSRKEIKVFDLDGKLLDTWKVEMKVSAICLGPEETIYIGAPGKLARLDKKGKILKTVAAADGKFPKAKVSGLTVDGKDLFATFGSGRSLRSTGVLVRLNLDMGEAKTLAEKLRGCCQRLDVTSKDGVIYLAENTRHRIVKYDREGKVLGKWGKADRRGADLAGFGSCCNPMNLYFGPEGELYTSESGLGRVKRYDVDGKFLGLVGYAAVPRFNRAGRKAASCSNIATLSK